MLYSSGMTERTIAASYLQGLFDGEGSVTVTTRQRKIRISNTEKSILNQAIKCLNILGIDSKIHWSYQYRENRKRCKPCANIVIMGRRNTILFCRYVGSHSTAKREKLRLLRISYRRITRYRRYRYHRYKSLIFQEQIRKLYSSGMTLHQVGKKLGCTGETVSKVLKIISYPVRQYSPEELGRLGSGKRHKNHLKKISLPDYKEARSSLLWSKHFNECQKCHTTNYPYSCRGFCSSCYQTLYRLTYPDRISRYRQTPRKRNPTNPPIAS